MNTALRNLPPTPEPVCHAYFGLWGIFMHLACNWNEISREPEFANYVFPPCHVVARALVRKLPDLEFRDGYLITLKYPTKELDEEGISKTVLIQENKNGKPLLLPVITVIKWHSWLVFKEHANYILDPIPLGTILSAPSLVYRDDFALPYIEEALPEECVPSEADIQKYVNLLGRVGEIIVGSKIA